jgi:H+-transporting ATPase
MAGDLEIGDAAAERAHQQAIPNEKTEHLEEYTNLVRYISTYRDVRATTNEEVADEEAEPKRKAWWAFWRSNEAGPDGGYEIPEDWLNTDLKGLTSADVELRRKKTGYNELSDIKENLFLKFIGFFQGPVLYGKHGSISLK